MILPAENKMNVEEDLTPEQLENLTVHYVKTIEEVLRIALPGVGRGETSKLAATPPPPAKVEEAIHQNVLTRA